MQIVQNQEKQTEVFDDFYCIDKNCVDMRYSGNRVSCIQWLIFMLWYKRDSDKVHVHLQIRYKWSCFLWLQITDDQTQKSIQMKAKYVNDIDWKKSYGREGNSKYVL